MGLRWQEDKSNVARVSSGHTGAFSRKHIKIARSGSPQTLTLEAGNGQSPGWRDKVYFTNTNSSTFLTWLPFPFPPLGLVDAQGTHACTRTHGEKLSVMLNPWSKLSFFLKLQEKNT